MNPAVQAKRNMKSFKMLPVGLNFNCTVPVLFFYLSYDWLVF